MPTYPLARLSEPLTAPVTVDDTLIEALRPFDLDPDAVTEFYPWAVPDEVPTKFGIGLLVGASGSGKSTLLAHFGQATSPNWHPAMAIASHFDSPEDAAARLYAVGLNSAPAWRQPYHTLSTGQRFRADLARVIGDGAVVDEFTSVVDRNVAASASRALRAWVDRVNVRGLVVASCHRDVIPWLRPDWVLDTDAGTLVVGEADSAPVWWAEFVKPDREVARVYLG